MPPPPVELLRPTAAQEAEFASTFAERDLGLCETVTSAAGTGFAAAGGFAADDGVAAAGGGVTAGACFATAELGTPCFMLGDGRDAEADIDEAGYEVVCVGNMGADASECTDLLGIISERKTSGKRVVL